MKLVTPPGPSTTVAEWCEWWFANLDSRSSTRGDYRHTLDHFVIPTLGGRSLVSLRPADVEAAGRLWSARLGPNTLRKNLGIFAAACQSACRAGLLTTNPARLARKPRSRKVETTLFTPTELTTIIDHPKAGPFALLAGVGCRIGEALALDVTDFTTPCRLTISKTYSREHGTRPPKSENGRRSFNLPASVIPAILKAIGHRKKGPLFPSQAGTRRQYPNTRRQWRGFLKLLGLAYRRPHTLRHSVGSAMVARGVPLANVAEYLGDSVQTIVRTYLHPVEMDPADVLEEIFQGGRKVDGSPSNGAKMPAKPVGNGRRR